jgi:hypothetical protein
MDPDFGNDMREEAFDNDFNMQDADPGIGLGGKSTKR